MIKIKVSDLMGKHKMNRKTLAELSGIHPTTVRALYRETLTRIDLETLNRLCETFDCEISDILEYIPDDDHPSRRETTVRNKGR